MPHELKDLTALMADINKLEEAYNILEALYNQLGPYGVPYNSIPVDAFSSQAEGKISWKLWQKVNDFFHFDDSEEI